MLLERVTLLVFGLWACATSVIFIRESTVHPVVLAGYRLLFAALFLLPLYAAALKQYGGGLNRSRLRRTLLPAVFLAVHLASWNYGARMTPAANATILVNLLPLATPFLLLVVVKERVNRGEIDAVYRKDGTPATRQLPPCGIRAAVVNGMIVNAAIAVLTSFLNGCTVMHPDPHLIVVVAISGMRDLYA